MKDKILAYILVISILFSSGFISYAEDDETKRIINDINEIRSSVNVPELVLNDKLSDSATDHNKYMYYNNSLSSIEESDRTYYRGRYPADRALYYLYENPYVYELSCKDKSTYMEGIDDFLNNPYSRTVLLDPLYKDIGLNDFESFYTYVFGGKERTANYEVIYPYNDQIDIPISWENNYLIDPYSNLDIEDDLLGLPITYTYYSDSRKVQSFNDIDIKLINVNEDREIPITILSPSNDKYLKSTVVILPLEEYDYNTTYEVSLKMVIDFYENEEKVINKKIHFETEVLSNGVGINNSMLLTRENAVEDIVEVLDYPLVEPLDIIFKDVDINSVKAKYIYTAYNENIINGIGEQNFGPKLNITNEQVYSILIRAYEKKYGEIIIENKKIIGDDTDISQWNDGEIVDNIYKAQAIDILILNSDQLLKPKSYMTESEFNEIIIKYKEAVTIADIDRQKRIVQ